MLSDDYDAQFRRLGDEGPSSEFVDRLLDDVRAASEEYRPGDDVVVDLDRADQFGGESGPGRRVPRWLAAAAVVLLVATAAAMTLLADPGDDVATTPDRTGTPLDAQLRSILAGAAAGDLGDIAELERMLAGADRLTVMRAGAPLVDHFALSADGGWLVTVGARVEAIEVHTGTRRSIASVRDEIADLSNSAEASRLGGSYIGMLGRDGSESTLVPASRVVLIDAEGNELRLADSRLSDEEERAIGIANNQLWTIGTDGRPINVVSIRGTSLGLRPGNVLEGSPAAQLIIVDREPTFAADAGIAVWPTTGDELDPDHPLIEAGVAYARHVAFSPDGSTTTVFVGDELMTFDTSTWTILSRVPAADVEEVTYVGDRHVSAMTAAGVETWDIEVGLRVGDILPGQQNTRRAADERSGLAASDRGYVAAVSSVDPDRVDVWAVTPEAWIEVGCEIVIAADPGAASDPALPCS